MADNITVKNASGVTYTMRTIDKAGIHSTAMAGYDPQDDMLKIKSMQKKFRDSFVGAAVDATKWVASAGTGMTVTVGSGLLTIASGVTASAVTTLTSVETFTVPFRLSFSMTMTQRIANHSVLFEAVSVNATTLVADGLNVCGLVFDGTVATTNKYRVGNGGAAVLDSGLVTFPTTAAAGVYELEPFSDEVWFHGSTLDSTTARANSYRRHQQIPDPNALYKLRITVKNEAVAPATTTSASFQFVACQDYAELTAEITAGRGQSVAGQAIAVAVTTVPTTTVTGTVAAYGQDNVFYNESVTAQAGAATVTGTTRDVAVAAGTVHRYTSFNASALADQAGTLRIECSNDNVTWRYATIATAVVANTPLYLRVPVMTRYYRAVYVNGATVQTVFMLNTAFSK